MPARPPATRPRPENGVQGVGVPSIHLSITRAREGGRGSAHHAGAGRRHVLLDPQGVASSSGRWELTSAPIAVRPQDGRPLAMMAAMISLDE